MIDFGVFEVIWH